MGQDINKARRLYYSPIVESTFGTAATMSRCALSLLTGDPLAPTELSVSDTEFSAGGAVATDFETAHIVKGYDFPAQPYPLIATNELILQSFLKALGHDALTSLGGSLYSHQGPASGTPSQANLPVYPAGFTIEEHMGGEAAVADSDYKFLGMQLSAVELSWGETDMAVVTWTLVGSGKTDAASITSESGTITTPMTFVTPMQIRTWIKAAPAKGQTAFDGHEVSASAWAFPTINSGATDLGAQMMGGKVRFDGALGTPRQGQAVGAGIYTPQRKQGKRTASAELKLRIDDTTRPLLKKRTGSTWDSQNEYTVGFDIMGQTAGHGVQIVLPLCAPPVVSGGAGSGEAVRTLTFNARKVTAGTDYGPISIYGVNGENLDYATAA